VKGRVDSLGELFIAQPTVGEVALEELAEPLALRVRGACAATITTVAPP